MSGAGDTLTLETSKGPVVIEMNPASRRVMWRTSSASSRRASMTASSFTA